MSAVDVVIPAWNSRQWLAGCLDSLRRQSLAPVRIFVVDDGSTDGTAEWIGEHAPDVSLERSARRRGFAAAANRGIAAGSSPLVALLNADTRVDPDWLRLLVEALAATEPEVGFAASKMLQMEAPEVIDNAGDRFSRYGSALKRGHGDPTDRWTESELVLSASAGAALYRRSMLDDIGLFDESFDSYLEDIELGLRAQLAGYRCLFVPAATLLHQGGGAALPRGRYVRLATANRLATVLQCFPSRLLVRHAPRVLWAQWYFLLASRHPRQTFMGYLDLARRLPAVMRKRRLVQRSRRIGIDAFDRSLDRRLGEPPLRSLIRRRLGRR